MTSQFDETGYLAKPPISAHRAFAPIVALWFAALLGLGSMVLPVAQIERLVHLTGIANYLSVVAPPLDLTGRLIFAGVLALLGGAIGHVIARRLGASHAEFTAEETDSEMRAPVSAHEELGDAGTEEDAPRRSRRLAIDDDAQEEDVIEFAPLPAALTDELEVAEEDEKVAADADGAEPEAAEEDVTEPDEENELELLEEVALEEVVDLAEIDVPEPAVGHPEQEIPAEADIEPVTSEEEEIEQEEVAPELAEKPMPAPSPCELRPLEELGLLQLVERLGASMERHRAMRDGNAVPAATLPVVQPEPAMQEHDLCDEEIEEAAQEREAGNIDIAASVIAAEAEPAPEPVVEEEVAEEEPLDLATPAPEVEDETETAPSPTEEVIEAEPEVTNEEVVPAEPEVEAEAVQAAEAEVVDAGSDDVVEEGETAEPETAQPVEEEPVDADTADLAEEGTIAEPEAETADDEADAELDAFETGSKDTSDECTRAEAELEAPLASPFTPFTSFDEDEEDEDEELATLADSFRLPVANTPVAEDQPESDAAPENPTPEPIEDQAEEDEADDEGEGDEEVYGSLLSLRRPFPLDAFVDSDDEAETGQEEAPAEIAQDGPSQPSTVATKEKAEEEAPSAAPPPTAPSRDLDSEAHERALRDALVSLQRLDRAG